MALCKTMLCGSDHLGFLIQTKLKAFVRGHSMIILFGFNPKVEFKL